MAIKMEMRFDLSPQLVALTGDKAGQVVRHTADALRDRAKAKIQRGPKTGRVYRSRTKPSPHQASAPGEAPASWSKELEESIVSVVVGERTSEVQVGAEYGGKYLEQGTPGGKIKPRPFLAPSAEEQRPLFVRDMMEAVRQAAREAVREAVGKLG